MKMSLKFLAAVILPLAWSCSVPHLIKNPEYLNLVDSSFNSRRELASKRSVELFSVFERELSARQTEAMKFLYAFMPLCDLADYSGDFFLANADASLRALDESPWGKEIPEEVFLHYVLPCRVNNENLDSFRLVCYDEIKGRIKGMNMTDAALEINHWCHEKVSYQPADIRTSAPMSTILSARGRCGEESTFTVAALRTAGIPARQVYTPRWAHTDDNHAWVEIWSGGIWYYMGACEPEPVVDRGWFTEPARRAMLIHTRAFGASLSGENAVNRYRYYTEVNNLSKYAVTKKIFIRVKDSNGAPAKGAKVEYQLYNYAEFYPLAVVPCDDNGISSFETGLGDLLIWAYDKEAFNYSKISVGETDTLTLVLDRRPGGNSSQNMDLNPPLALAPLPDIPKELSEQNSKRLTAENEIRQKYINGWITPAEARDFAAGRKLDTARVMKIFARSMGNYQEIKKFLAGLPEASVKPALDMLEILPDKDLRDSRAAVLSDHLHNTPVPDGMDEAKYRIFVEYILNPRVANEMLTGWRSSLKSMLPAEMVSKAADDPLQISAFLEKNIRILNDENYCKTPLTPTGVLGLGISDSFSRDICFVDICRSLNIPARLEPGSNVPQYYLDSAWHDIYFSDRTPPSGKKGFIRLTSSERKPVPEYYTHFTIARFDNGRYNTLEYDYEKKITDFKGELSLAPGSYMLVTGNRLASSRILTSISFFDLSEGEHKTVDVKIRKDPEESKILGKLDLEQITELFDKSGVPSGRISEKGVVILWIEPDKEPTRHIFTDLPHLKKEFDEWGGYFLFLTDPASGWTGFKKEELAGLPANLLCSKDKTVLGKTLNAHETTDLKYPVVILADKHGNILYESSGYRIGLGEQLLKYTR